MSKIPTLKSLDTELAFVTARSVRHGSDCKTPTTKSSAYPKTPSTSIPRTPLSAFSKTPSVGGMPRLIGRRQTTRTFGPGVVDETEALAYDDGEDSLTSTGKFLLKIRAASGIVRYTFYILPVAMLLAIPVIITANPPHDNARADGIRLLGLFIWIEIVWVAFWVAKLVAQALPILLQAACGLISTGIRMTFLLVRFSGLTLVQVFESTRYCSKPCRYQYQS